MTVRSIPKDSWFRRLWSKLTARLVAPIVDNWYYPAVVNSHILTKIEKLGEMFKGEDVIIRGEVLGPGIQENIYKLEAHKVVVFDIQVGGKYLDAIKFTLTCQQLNIERAPILSIEQTLRQWLDGKTIAEASDGVSKLFDTKREGIVIKPMLEKRDPRLGRLMFKKRGPIYLADNDL